MSVPRLGTIPLGPVVRVDREMLQARERRFKAELARRTHDFEHFWVAGFLYLVTPPLESGILFDTENLLRGPDVMCYICEQEWTDDIDPICPGDPNGDRGWHG